MKKFIALVISLLMVLSLAACSGGSSEEGAASDDAKTVGIAMPTKSLERWNRDGEYLKEQF